MKCLACNQDLRTSDREGIEILYCVQCGGIWLERGKLEQIVARVANRVEGDETMSTFETKRASRSRPRRR